MISDWRCGGCLRVDKLGVCSIITESQLSATLVAIFHFGVLKGRKLTLVKCGSFVISPGKVWGLGTGDSDLLLLPPCPRWEQEGEGKVLG